MLGYPLTPLGVLFDSNSNNSHGQSYAQAATDIQVNANDGFWGAVTSSWNPLSHLQYCGGMTLFWMLLLKQLIIQRKLEFTYVFLFKELNHA